MASIRSIGTALPAYCYTPQQIAAVGDDWLGAKSDERALFQRFVTASQTLGRHFVLPASDMMQLGGLADRTELFEEHAPKLGATALNTALSQGQVQPQEISHLIFTSCSCPSIPSIDALILEHSGLRPTVSRTPIFQHGCAAGVVGLSLAADLTTANRTIALTCVELCSLVFQPHSATPAQLVGSAIFADGAAAAIIVPSDEGLTIRSHQSYLIPDSRHLMGYNLHDEGFHLRLDRDLPRSLADVAPDRVREFLAASNLTPEQVTSWLFHPGGIKILNFLEKTFALRTEQAHWSRDVLSHYGNLSSASVLFVLNEYINSKVSRPGDHVLMLGIGPGLTLELILFEVTS